MEIQIFDPNMRRLICACAGVVKEQQECMVPGPDFGSLVWNCQQCIDLPFLQIAYWDRSRPFGFHGTDLSAPLHILRTAFGDEGGKPMHSSESLISARDTALPFFFDIAQELPQQLCMDIGDKTIVHLPMQTAGGIDDQQASRIAISSLRIASEIPLSWTMLHQ